jgi:peroxiredoxin-like protein
MGDLSFDVELSWSQAGGGGAGALQTNDLTLQISGPGSMGGLGVGASPEDLLVSAVSSCYVATLFRVLRGARLPVDSLAVSATGTVTGFPGHVRFARIVVNPRVLGGDSARREEYEAAASVAHDRCFIGRALAPEVAYEVGSLQMREDATLAPVAEGAQDRAAPGAPPADRVDVRAC